jgi:hypothetical protein
VGQDVIFFEPRLDEYKWVLILSLSRKLHKAYPT